MNVDKLNSFVILRKVLQLDQSILGFNVFEPISCVKQLGCVEVDCLVVAFLLRAHLHECKHLIDIILFDRNFLAVVILVEYKFNWFWLSRDHILPPADTNIKHETLWSNQIFNEREGKNLKSKSDVCFDLDTRVFWNRSIYQLDRSVCVQLLSKTIIIE